MLAKEIKYTDYNDVERTETYHFNLSKAELLELNLSEAGGLENRIKNIISAQDIPKIIHLFKDIILKSYGVKSPDGKRFIKNPELVEEFSQTEAYTELFMELAGDAQKAADFINGIIPNDMKDAVAEASKEEMNKIASITSVN